MKITDSKQIIMLLFFLLDLHLFLLIFKKLPSINILNRFERWILLSSYFFSKINGINLKIMV